MAVRFSWGLLIPFIVAVSWAVMLGCQQGGSVKQTDAENTAINARDQGGAEATPTDQGNNEADLAVTQNIRKAVVADESLSLLAKNVKIITVGGMVTLRGPVESETEKVRIAAIAEQTPGVARVDNQLEIASAQTTTDERSKGTGSGY